MRNPFFFLILILALKTYAGSSEDDKGLSFDQFQIPVGSAPTAVEIFDFNHDNLPDLVVSNREDGTITVLKGDGNGQFDLHSTVPAGEYPTEMAAGDFDEDGWTDLIVPNHGTKYVTILYGGERGFVQRKNSHIAIDVSSHSHRIEVADMNNDGNLDFIIDDHGRDGLKLYFGQGNGQFPQSVSIPAGIAPAYGGITVKDLDVDGNQDVVISNQVTTAIVLGDGKGRFSVLTELDEEDLRRYNVAFAYADINAVADINGDGFPDVGAGSGEGALSVWFGNSDGRYHFDPYSPYQIVQSVTSVGVADVNGDGYKDFLVTSFGEQALMLLLGGTGRLRPVHIKMQGHPRRITASDLNNDGLTDLVTANTGDDEISVFLQRKK